MRYLWGAGDVVLADERPIASAHRAWFRERAEVTVGGDAWLFRAEAGDRVAETQGQVRIRARKRGFWSSGYDVDSAHASYSLGPRNVWGSRLVLSRHGSEVGEVRRSSLWANRPELTTSVELPDEDAVFVLWLAYLIKSREDASGYTPSA